MMRIGFTALLSHWVRHPGQFLTLVLGLALATALWSGVQAINAEARSSYAAAAASMGQDELEVLVNPTGFVAQSDYVTLRRAGWAVSPVLEGRITVSGADITLVGIDPITTPLAQQPVRLDAPDELAQFLAGKLGFALPETIAGLGAADLGFVLAPAAALAPDQVIVDIGLAQALLGQPGQVSRLVLAQSQGVGRAPLATLMPDLVRQSPPTRSDVASLTDSFHLNLTAFGLLAFAVGLFIVYAAIGLAFEQRRPMLRTLRALGLPQAVLIRLLLAEVLAIALLAGVVGVVLGYWIAAALLPDVAATLRGLYGAQVSASLSLNPSWWISGIAISVLGALAAAAQSLWRLLHMPLLASAQPQAWMRAMQISLRWQMALALGCFAIAGVSIVLFQGLIAGFVMLATLLIGCAMALPGILSVTISGLASRARAPLTQWFWADTRQQVPGLSMALMALMLALATNIGVGTMVSSFRQTFVGWLDQRLVSEFYVTARTADEALRLRDYLEPRVDAILPIWRSDTTLAGALAQVYAVADHPTYRDNWPLIAQSPDAWTLLAQGQGVLVNEQFWRRSGMRLGQDLAVSQTLRLPIVGIYSDYGNPKAQAMISVPQFVAHFPHAPRLGFALRMDPAAIADLRADLGQDFGLPDAVMIDQQAIKRFSLGVFERTFAVSAALNILTLGVAGFAMLTSLLTLATMRLPQIAPVWALGVDQARIARLELVRAVFLAALTAIIAIPVGLMLAWSLLSVVNVEAFGWRLPMYLYPAQWGILAVLAVFVSVLASAGPVWRLGRMSPAALLRVFSNER